MSDLELDALFERIVPIETIIHSYQRQYGEMQLLQDDIPLSMAVTKRRIIHAMDRIVRATLFEKENPPCYSD